MSAIKFPKQIWIQWNCEVYPVRITSRYGASPVDRQGNTRSEFLYPMGFRYEADSNSGETII